MFAKGLILSMGYTMTVKILAFHQAKHGNDHKVFVNYTVAIPVVYVQDRE